MIYHLYISYCTCLGFYLLCIFLDGLGEESLPLTANTDRWMLPSLQRKPSSCDFIYLINQGYSFSGDRKCPDSFSLAISAATSCHSPPYVVADLMICLLGLCRTSSCHPGEVHMASVDA